AEIVVVVGWRRRPPERLAGVGRQALDHFLGLEAVEQNQLAAGDGGAAEATANLALPELRGAAPPPGGANVRVGGDAVACRPEELRPVAAAGGQWGQKQD